MCLTDNLNKKGNRSCPTSLNAWHSNDFGNVVVKGLVLAHTWTWLILAVFLLFTANRTIPGLLQVRCASVLDSFPFSIAPAGP